MIKMMEDRPFQTVLQEEAAVLPDDGPALLLVNRDAEVNVLGSLLIDPEKFYDVSRRVRSEDFYFRKHQWIFQAIHDLINDGMAVDPTTVAGRLSDVGRLAEIGGQNYLLSLTIETASSLGAESYARIVQEKSARRQLVARSAEIAALAKDESTELDTVFQSAEQKLYEIHENQANKGFETAQDVIQQVFSKLHEKAQSKEEFHGLPTGFTDLDKLLGGMHPSDLMIVAARPGMGKTSFLMSVLRHAALNVKKNVVFFSLEMSNDQIMQRLLSQESGIDSRKIRDGRLASDELQSLLISMDVIGDSQIFLDDTPGITPMALRSKLQRLKREADIDLIIIDYLQLMSGDLFKDNRVQEVSYISRNLKILAKEFSVPVLTAAQMSRSVEQRADKLPMLSDLRESGSLEQDADIVMFLHQPDSEAGEGLEGLVKLIVAKHRNGPIGDIDLVYRKNLARFDNAARMNDYGG